jgi:hypothetical protein
LLIGCLFAFAAVGSGFILSLEGGYVVDLLTLHRNAGIATAIFSLLFYFLRRTAIYFFGDKGKRKWARIVLFSLMITLLSFTGHLGGSLTHGSEYLSVIAPSSASEEMQLGISSPEQLDSAALFTAVIQPILRSRCYSCHSATRQKGQLRLDQIALIEKGGKHGAVLWPGLPDSSALYARLMLPHEHEDHMPPNEKEQPSSAEIALIQVWIAEGADFEKRGAAYHAHQNIGQYVKALLIMGTRPALVPDEPVNRAPTQAIAALEDRGAVVVRLGESSNYLSVTLINHDKSVTAYHEGGHAVVAAAMNHTDPVTKVTILPRGRALGYTMVMPTEDRYSKTRNQLLDNLAYAMGGRVAEEVVFGDPSTGASNDISQATEIARQMVTEYGMSPKVGSVRLASASGEVFMGRDMGHGREYSEDLAATVDIEVRTLMDNAMAEATAALNANRKVLDALAAQLLEEETLNEAELAVLFAKIKKAPARSGWVSGDWAGTPKRARAIKAPVKRKVEPKDALPGESPDGTD